MGLFHNNLSAIAAIHSRSNIVNISLGIITQLLTFLARQYYNLITHSLSYQVTALFFKDVCVEENYQHLCKKGILKIVLLKTHSE